MRTVRTSRSAPASFKHHFYWLMTFSLAFLRARRIPCFNIRMPVIWRKFFALIIKLEKRKGTISCFAAFFPDQIIMDGADAKRRGGLVWILAENYCFNERQVTERNLKFDKCCLVRGATALPAPMSPGAKLHCFH